MKSFESIGLWFLPSEPERQVPGTLTFSQEEGLALKLSGTFQSGLSLEHARYPLIHGIVNESTYGRFVSLFDCFSTGLRVGVPGIVLETVRANHGFAGVRFVDSAAMLFQEAVLNFAPLAAWLNYSGLLLEYEQSSENTSAKWQLPAERRCNIDGATVSIGFELSVQSELAPRSVTFEEIPSLRVADFGNATAEDIHSRFVGALSQLMTLASESSATLDRYRLLALNDDEIPNQFDRLYSPVGLPEKIRSKTPEALLFTLSDVPGGLEAFMPSWFRFVQTHPDFCAMFFSYGYETKGLLGPRFLFHLLAAECLVREDLPDDLTVQALGRVRDSMVGPLAAIGQYTDLALPEASRLAAPYLLADVISRYRGLLQELIGDSEERFIRTLYSTYRYITHRVKHGPDAMHGANLFWLVERLAAVIKVCVLKSLEFPDDKVMQIVAGNPRMAHLKTIKAPWNKPNDD